MALYHHGSKDYNVAASDAARHARTIMQKKIDGGLASAQALFERINRQVPQDRIVRARGLDFFVTDSGVQVAFQGPSTPAPEQGETLHNHALGQIAEKAGIPEKYLRELSNGEEPWQQALAAHALNEHFRTGQPDDRYLVRSVGGQVRGFLSDKFRRLDSRPLVEAFAESCADVGAIPCEGTATDTRVVLKAFLPMVFEPVENEVLCLGIEWGNSDFGAARHTVRAMIWRLWCTNFATLEDTLAQVHLGGKLSDNIEFSQRTYELDTAASVSALRDVVKGLLGPAKVNALLDTIKAADEKKVEWKNVKSSLQKRLLKGELKAVEDAYQSEDVVNLPPGQTAWRASNALSWFAKRVEDPDRRLEIERIAGEIVNGKRDVEGREEAA